MVALSWPLALSASVYIIVSVVSLQVTSIKNFRPVFPASSVPLFRSGAPDSDLASLTNFTIFDLRNSDEINLPDDYIDDDVDNGVTIVNRPLLFPDRVWSDVRDNEWTLVECVTSEITSIFSSSSYSKSLYSTLENGGISSLYRVILRTSVKEVNEVINEIISTSITSKNPILINCAKGKDRTGLICAILHLLVGIDDDIIILEYSKSEGNLNEDRTVNYKESGLDWSKFRGSPSIAMVDTLDYIRSEGYINKLNLDVDKLNDFKIIINNNKQ
ncbi:hypothetical protein TL16_g09757 [Triparma laevis f. inornata]|uniref:Tyrosine specific protein phosphatases domain-containing protein n=2 Tax=Triparma laevis TaxID=1534972 RepID=A0A9W7E7I8_9STRA|nr:hypothetical protein TrLO_g15092 [Triparma laevis f. longispina]GMH83928.1 hypothetical protein TL16_g09757 [Triparma laevis f. inornata]